MLIIYLICVAIWIKLLWDIRKRPDHQKTWFWPFFVIGLIDNFLRPYLVGKETKLPDYLVLLTTLGGVSLVGLSGFVIGPIIAALFLTFWSLLKLDQNT